MRTLASKVLCKLRRRTTPLERSPFGYLNDFDKALRPTRFEELAVEAFAGLLHVVFYDAPTEDAEQVLRATWRGGGPDTRNAPGNAADGLIRAAGFFILVEATLREKSDQWAREFAQVVRHAKQETKSLDTDPADVYCVLVAPTVFDDTFESTRSYNERSPHKIIPLELKPLAHAVETSAMALTIRHADVRRLLIRLVECLAACSDVGSWRRQVQGCVSAWRSEVLAQEKTTTIALKSYEAMIRSGQERMAMSEILLFLNRDRTLQAYLKRLRVSVDPKLVEGSLVQESLVAETKKIDLTGDIFFVPIPLTDFCARCDRRRLVAEHAYRMRVRRVT